MEKPFIANKTSDNGARPAGFGSVPRLSADIQNAETESSLTSRSEEEMSFEEDYLLNSTMRLRSSRRANEGHQGVTDVTTLGQQSTFSVGREFDKLQRENDELIERIYALNVVKDDLIFQVEDLKNELQASHERVSQLEKEVKRLRDKHLSDSASSSSDNGDASGQDAASTSATGDETVTQRRRFTRMEFARALIERNTYKERLIELQETVRWVESLRSRREGREIPQTDQRTNSSRSFIRNFFRGLLGTEPQEHQAPLQPPPPIPAGLFDVGNTLSARRFQGPLDSADVDAQRQHHRSIVSQSPSGHGRVDACGWSIPASTSYPNKPVSRGQPRSPVATKIAGATAPVVVTTKPEIPVPIPICCQQLPGSLNGMKIWSAAVAFSSFGEYSDGSRLFERSVVHRSPQSSPSQSSGSRRKSVLSVSDSFAKLEEEQGQLSSVAWLTCTSNNVDTHVFLVDLRQPSVLPTGFKLDAPYVSQICAVPGAKPTDIPWQSIAAQNVAKREETMDDNFVEMSRASDKSKSSKCAGWTLTTSEQVKLKPSIVGESASGDTSTPLIDNTRSLLMPTMWLGAQDGSLFIYSAASAVQPAIDDPPQQLPGILGRVQLPGTPTAIAHVAGRVFVALSTSEVAIFHRTPETREWCTDECSIIAFKRDLAATASNTAESTTPVSVSNSVPPARCCVSVANRYLWIGLGCEVLVIEPAQLRIESSFIWHPHPHAQLRLACSVADGVWLANRLDSVLRLFHAFTHQLLQKLDLQPVINSFIFGDATPIPGDNTPMRLTAIGAGGGRLWIGTHTGLIVSVSFASAEQQVMIRTGSSNSVSTPAGDKNGTKPATNAPPRQRHDASVQIPDPNLVPYCWVGGAQISCHGHTDIVKAIVCSPVTASNNTANTNAASVEMGMAKQSGVPTLGIMSVGEGYRDHRPAVAIQQDTSSGSRPLIMNKSVSPSSPGEERIYMIVWQMAIMSGQK